MISLEKRGVLKNSFKKPFRRKPLWSVDWSDYQPDDTDTSQSLSQLGGIPTAKKKVDNGQSELSKQHDKEPD